MAQKKRSPQASALDDPPSDFLPTPAVPEPILNGPYTEPNHYWKYTKVSENVVTPEKTPGRRPASYFFKERSTARQLPLLSQADEGGDELELVNRLRADVKRWREAKRDSYKNSSKATKDLLAYWFRSDRVGRRFFFCQREAVETVIYLLEVALPGGLGGVGFKPDIDQGMLAKLLRGDRTGLEGADDLLWPRLVDDPGDGRLPLTRLGCKMATGSGKTLVMAMLITWAFVNRGLTPKNDRFPSGVLVCAPNLTVRKRLRVLLPQEPGNYYDEFDLVPSGLRHFLNQGQVLVTNWHAFAPKNEHTEGGVSYRVVDKGAEPADAFTKDRLGDLADRTRLPLLVLNDEGHHCWRPNPRSPAEVSEDEEELGAEHKKALEEDKEEARVWLDGLDRINNSGLRGKDDGGKPLPCVLAAVDLSATPFYLANSGYSEGSPFPWLVSDFGLLDAIESGIVKVPRLPVLDDSGKKDEAGRPDPKYFRLWRHIQDAAKKNAAARLGRRMKPAFVYKEAESALKTLAGQWRVDFEAAQRDAGGGAFIPPVLIVVCDDTNLADYVYQKISGERQDEQTDESGKKSKVLVYGNSTIEGVSDLLANDERVHHTIRIDSRMLAALEGEGAAGKEQTRDQAALALRNLIDTVGKPGQPGEQVRCVVSVSMLTEGWDANNVKYILGLRAFGSQLLCEQVVGRGLRRRSYEIDKRTGMLPEEHVDVYGIPFSLIPFRGKAKGDKKADPVQRRIFSVPGREGFRIEMPVVEGFSYDVQDSQLCCDVDQMDELILNKEPSEVFLAAPRGYETEGATVVGLDFVRQTRAAYYASVRMNQIVFRLAQQITDDLLSGKGGDGKAKLSARHRLFPAVVRIVRDYVEKKVRTASDEVDKRDIALEKYATILRERLRTNITTLAADAVLLPVINSYQETLSTADRDYSTARPVYRLGKSELSAAIVRSDGGESDIGERTAIDLLEELDCVEAFAPNDHHLAFHILYEYQEAPRRYEPDFIVKLRSDDPKGRYVLIEVKGGKGEVHDADLVRAKDAAAKQWAQAVNNTRRFGTWSYVICRGLPELRAALLQRAGQPASLPFALVQPHPGAPYTSCVPLLGLRAAVARAQQAQGLMSLTIDAVGEWASFARPGGFCPGMFVARVFGTALAPEVPAGSYCLFAAVPQGDAAARQGRRLLVTYPSLLDEELGANYTVRRYESKPREDGRRDILLRGSGARSRLIELTLDHEEELTVVAELVEVIS